MRNERDRFRARIERALKESLENDNFKISTLIWDDDLHILADAVIGVFESEKWEQEVFDYLSKVGFM